LPASENTHKYAQTTAVNRESGEITFYAGCLVKKGVPALKEHWDAHNDEQRRKQAWPTTFNTLAALGRGQKPDHAIAYIVEGPRRLAAQVTRALKALPA